MPDPAMLRDSTQLVVPAATLADARADLEERFTLTFVETDVPADEADGRKSDRYVRVIGSPVEIKAASDFLSRRGVQLR